MWPHQVRHVGLLEHLLGQAVLGLIERRRPGLDLLVLAQGGGDGGVHALGVDLANDLVGLLVHVLAPDGDADHDFSFLARGGMWFGGSVGWWTPGRRASAWWRGR